MDQPIKLYSPHAPLLPASPVQAGMGSADAITIMATVLLAIPLLGCACVLMVMDKIWSDKRTVG